MDDDLTHRQRQLREQLGGVDPKRRAWEMAYLHEKTFVQIGRALGIDAATAWRWAREHDAERRADQVPA